MSDPWGKSGVAKMIVTTRGKATMNPTNSRVRIQRPGPRLFSVLRAMSASRRKKPLSWIGSWSVMAVHCNSFGVAEISN